VRIREVEGSLGYPCFVKPANLGSSVGIGMAVDAESLRAASTRRRSSTGASSSRGAWTRGR
jgi:D-alanine-D-alanine ligase-like ATP-grasp enzyme